MTTHHQQFIISVMSRDRVGIVHEVAQAISELEGDIADLRQSVLRGYFSMILLASFPTTITTENIRIKLSEVDANSATALEVAVKRVKDIRIIDNVAPPEHTYVLTASGPDRIGFVAALAAFCAQHQINILDLSTAVADGIYTMILLVDVSRNPSIDAIRQELYAFSRQNDMNIVLQHHDIFRATNEISL